MKKSILLSVLLLIWACDFKKDITENQVVSTIEGFFNALDVDNYNCEKLGEWVTDDFVLYEMEKSFNRNQFCEFVDGALSTMTETDWVLSDFTISIDQNSAHVFYRNKGRFVSLGEDGNEMVVNMEWLETVYIVRQENGDLKIKFLSSDDINS